MKSLFSPLTIAWIFISFVFIAARKHSYHTSQIGTGSKQINGVSGLQNYYVNEDVGIAAQNNLDKNYLIQMAAIKAILKLISTCGIGIYLSRVQVLNKLTMSALSSLVFYVFQPCLLFVSISSTIMNAKSSLGPIMTLPLAAILQTFLGYGIGIILSKLFYGSEESDNKKELLACSTFGNSGPLPFVFSDSLFRTHPDSTLLPKSIAYISMYLLGWSPLFWALGSMILGGDTSKMSPEDRRNQFLSRILSPPILACFAGLIVGFIPILQQLFLSPNGFLNPFLEAARTLSFGYLPAVMLVLGGSLLPTTSTPQDTSNEGSSTVKSTTELKSASTSKDFFIKIISIYLSRFVIMPIIALYALKLTRERFPHLTIEPILLFILLLQSCMPCAQSSTVILQLEGNWSAAASMARTLVVIYLLGVPAMTYWLKKMLLESALF